MRQYLYFAYYHICSLCTLTQTDLHQLLFDRSYLNLKIHVEEFDMTTVVSLKMIFFTERCQGYCLEGSLNSRNTFYLKFLVVYNPILHVNESKD